MKSSQSKSMRLNRRHFLKTTSLAAGALTFGVPTLLRGQNLNSKLNIAQIGVGGKGNSDVHCNSTENIVALCDVDTNNAADTVKSFPSAKFYRDFRVMFDEMANGIDAVGVATPDHFHAIAASAALAHGKHVYCQKPLTQTVYEARYLRTMANEKKLVTQMGNQGSSADGLRRAVEVIQDGLIGKVHQVHVWTNRPVWPQGMDRPAGEDPIPDTLSWDIWLGPAPARPYKKDATINGVNFRNIYQPFNWRGWQDFGTGALGDMACHTVNMPFRALQLGYPTEIEAEAFGVMNKETYPIGSKIRFEFPARKIVIPAEHETFFHRHDTMEQSPVTFWWYDGGKPLADNPTKHDGSNKPPREVTADIEAFRGEVPGSGCLLIGDKGQVFSPDDYGTEFFVKLTNDAKFIHYTKHPAVAQYPQRIPRNPFSAAKRDADWAHHQEWIAAIKENKPELCYSRFDISAQLAEFMLLGCVALRAGQKIEWDGPNMVAKNCPAAAPFIKRENRAGWTLA
ncbi:MAG TPA: Gfo/Idh/MocA family oxidoreductase [Verrucomicrobiae bacterium]|nr:Gfo/Idh/MocA family oxidoreductase [Verrucomicrobiae bacterium]